MTFSFTSQFYLKIYQRTYSLLSVDGTEALHQPFVFTLTLLVNPEDWKSAWIGEFATLGLPARFISGLITAEEAVLVEENHLLKLTLIFKSAAISLFIWPLTTWPSTSFSRTLSSATRRLNSKCRTRRCRSRPSRSIARSTAASSSSRGARLVRKSSAPLRIALTVVGMSPWPVRKITGNGFALRSNASWSCNPLIPGICRSATTHPGRSGADRAKKSWAHTKASTEYPTVIVHDKHRARSLGKYCAHGSNLILTTNLASLQASLCRIPMAAG